MRKALTGLLLLASCSALGEGTDRYHQGMAEVGRRPRVAEKHFARAEQLLGEALAEEDRTLDETVTATANRVRSLIELDRHEEAAALLSRKIPGYGPEGRHEGDGVGLALIRAHHLDPERGYAQLVLAEPWAHTERARLHLAWQQVRFLRALGTPKARAEAVRLCQQHAGKLDFDAMRKELSGN